ncbi:MAG: flavoprotein [Bdellovibrionales bacterium]
MNNTLNNKSILLIISGGIAAYKSLELIRLFKKSSCKVRCILTDGGKQFVTPLSVSALCEEPVYSDLWSLKNETEMGHIRLSREADLIIIAPASANIIAQIANGLAPDLATTALLANDDTPVLLAPTMNHAMWKNPATQDNIKTLKARGIDMVGPEHGSMACNEEGLGRMSEPEHIFEAAADLLK